MRAEWICLIIASLLIFGTGCKEAIEEKKQEEVVLKSKGEIIEELSLDDRYSLVIRRQNDNRTVTVSIEFSGHDQYTKEFSIGNAWFEVDSFIEAVDLDPETSATEYLITIPDRSSTYGAETGVIVYRLQWWEFLFVPDDRFSLEDIDGDGVPELTCKRIQKKSYSLSRGVLKEKDLLIREVP